MNIPDEVRIEFEKIRIDCPHCSGIDDEQYTCTSCWKVGGNGYFTGKEIIESTKPDSILKRANV